MMDEGRRTKDEAAFLRHWSLVFRHSSNNNAPPVHPGRGARSWCHPGLPRSHDHDLSGLQRPGLVTGGAGLDLPPILNHEAHECHEASHRSARFVIFVPFVAAQSASTPQLRSVLPGGRRRRSQPLTPLSGLRLTPYSLHHSFFECERHRFPQESGASRCGGRIPRLGPCVNCGIARAVSRPPLDREADITSGLHIKRAIDIGPGRRSVDGVVVASRRQAG